MGKKSCTGCEEFENGSKGYCSYSCNNQLEYENEFEVQKFVKELKDATGIYVSPSSIYKYKKIIEEFL